MLHKIDVRKLSEMTGSERAFLTLYISNKDGLNSLNKREENIRSLLAKNEDELEHFEESLKLVHKWLDENPPNSKSICLFASWAADFVEGYELPVEVKDQLKVGPNFYIRPLVELQDEYENFLIITADNYSAKILHIISAEEKNEDSIKGGVKNRVKKGGWSQKRYSRRRDNELFHYAKEISKKIDEILESENISRIILLGSKEAVEEIEAELSNNAQSKISGKKFIDLNEEKKEIMDEAYELYFEGERESEKKLWEKISEEYLSDGLAAAGATDVLKAAVESRIESMIVNRDAEIKGTKCRDCEMTVHGTPQTCQHCGSKSVFVLDLIDELTRLVELGSGETDFADHIDELEKLGNVAALLRY